MTQREKHPLAGTPVELTDGPYKGRYFIVVDWLQNQFHGKAMENIHKVHPEITSEVVERKGLDDKIVWGKLYPHQTLVAVHDEDMHSVSKSEKRRLDLQLINGGKDDTREPITGDREIVDPRGPVPEGRSVSGTEDDGKVVERDSETTETPKPRRGSNRTSKATTKSKAGDDS